MTVAEKTLLERVALGMSRPGASAPAGVTTSILAQAASSYGARPIVDEATVPTGFDPVAAALFESVVEAAFLVANADGDFDADERVAFQSVVLHACDSLVRIDQLEALLEDLAAQLGEDGLEKRARMIARTVTRADQQHEVLRIAALMAHVSGGIVEPERHVLSSLAQGFALDSSAVDVALAEAEQVLRASPSSE
jgi:tellurite resistance protein